MAFDATVNKGNTNFQSAAKGAVPSLDQGTKVTVLGQTPTVATVAVNSGANSGTTGTIPAAAVTPAAVNTPYNAKITQDQTPLHPIPSDNWIYLAKGTGITVQSENAYFAFVTVNDPPYQGTSGTVAANTYA